MEGWCNPFFVLGFVSYCPTFIFLPVLCVVRFWQEWFWLGNIWCVMLRVYRGYGLCDVIIFFFLRETDVPSYEFVAGSLLFWELHLQRVEQWRGAIEDSGLRAQILYCFQCIWGGSSNKWLPRERMSRVLSHESSLMIEYKEIPTDAASGGAVFLVIMCMKGS